MTWWDTQTTLGALCGFFTPQNTCTCKKKRTQRLNKENSGKLYFSMTKELKKKAYIFCVQSNALNWNTLKYSKIQTVCRITPKIKGFFFSCSGTGQKICDNLIQMHSLLTVRQRQRNQAVSNALHDEVFWGEGICPIDKNTFLLRILTSSRGAGTAVWRWFWKVTAVRA